MAMIPSPSASQMRSLPYQYDPASPHHLPEYCMHPCASSLLSLTLAYTAPFCASIPRQKSYHVQRFHGSAYAPPCVLDASISASMHEVDRDSVQIAQYLRRLQPKLHSQPGLSSKVINSSAREPATPRLAAHMVRTHVPALRAVAPVLIHPHAKAPRIVNFSGAFSAQGAPRSHGIIDEQVLTANWPKSKFADRRR
ncbi:hypothetical protein PLICRDRAFT_243008 [Plicaturopsis crispa FD-325 SS-3]|nr:hypothetical protein PLICRDRAFT_243008 [Plicaturopsis crispa FD-325 SS-3]